MKFKEILPNDKPREKLLTKGVSALTDSELLAIILRTGNKSESVKDLATKVLKHAGTLEKLSQYSINTLTKIEGIKLAKASSILASIELGKRIYLLDKSKVKLTNTEDIFNYFRSEFKNCTQEKFYVLLFDLKLNLIKSKELYKGTKSRIEINPSEVFKEAIIENASYIIVMHNHPSEDTTPSSEDYKTTEALYKVGELLNIKLIDHIIISYSSYFSFYAECKNLFINNKQKS